MKGFQKKCDRLTDRQADRLTHLLTLTDKVIHRGAPLLKTILDCTGRFESSKIRTDDKDFCLFFRWGLLVIVVLSNILCIVFSSSTSHTYIVMP